MAKVWLITGSARGLGRAILKTVLEAGDQVLATARDVSSLADLAARHGSTMQTAVLDVTDARAAREAVAAAVSAFGRLDVLVNNAGFGHMVPFEQTDEADFKAQIDTNFFGVVNLTRAALPIMRAQRSGHIINISSVGGRTGTPGLSAYQAAKWAVGGFTEVLAQEVAPFNVKVIALEPGGMRTEWGQTARGKKPDFLPDYEPSVGRVLQRLQGYVGHEIGDPAKVAGVIRDLAGRDRLPAHLLLGSDALLVVEQAEGVRRQDAADWLEISRSTDFDGTDLSHLARLLKS